MNGLRLPDHPGRTVFYRTSDKACFLKEHLQVGKYTLNLTDDAGKLGYVSFYIDALRRKMIFSGIKVNENRRGQGVAKEIIHELERISEALGLDFSETAIQRKPGVCALLARFGFKPIDFSLSRFAHVGRVGVPGLIGVCIPFEPERLKFEKSAYYRRESVVTVSYPELIDPVGIVINERYIKPVTLPVSETGHLVL